MQDGSDSWQSAATRLLTRQLLYTSCAYSQVQLCIQGQSAFLAALTPVLHSLSQDACSLGVSLSVLTSTNAASTKASSLLLCESALCLLHFSGCSTHKPSLRR